MISPVVQCLLPLLLVAGVVHPYYIEKQVNINRQVANTVQCFLNKVSAEKIFHLQANQQKCKIIIRLSKIFMKAVINHIIISVQSLVFDSGKKIWFLIFNTKLR